MEKKINETLDGVAGFICCIIFCGLMFLAICICH